MNSISKFMRWAEYRIAKEVQDQERIMSKIEDQFGSKGGARKTTRMYASSIEEKKTIVDSIDEMRSKGKTVAFAAEINNVAESTYRLWKRQIKQKEQSEQG